MKFKHFAAVALAMAAATHSAGAQQSEKYLCLQVSYADGQPATIFKVNPELSWKLQDAALIVTAGDNATTYEYSIPDVKDMQYIMGQANTSVLTPDIAAITWSLLPGAIAVEGAGDNCTLTVTDMAGRQVVSRTFSGATAVSGLLPGTYIAKVNAGNINDEATLKFAVK